MPTENRAQVANRLGLTGDNSQIIDASEIDLDVSLRGDVDRLYIGAVSTGKTVTVDIGASLAPRVLLVETTTGAGTVKIGVATIDASLVTIPAATATYVIICGALVLDVGAAATDLATHAALTTEAHT